MLRGRLMETLEYSATQDGAPDRLALQSCLASPVPGGLRAEMEVRVRGPHQPLPEETPPVGGLRLREAQLSMSPPPGWEVWSRRIGRGRGPARTPCPSQPQGNEILITGERKAAGSESPQS